MAISAPDIDPREFRNALGCFATGITIVTALTDDGQPVGLTANSFSSVSLNPPLVLFCLDRRATNFAVFKLGHRFVVNVLRDSQQELSTRFAKSDPDKFNGLDFAVWDSGVPVLRDCIANLQCVVADIAEGGDHVIVIGRVERMAYDQGGGLPLLYFRGRYSRCAAG